MTTLRDARAALQLGDWTAALAALDGADVGDDDLAAALELRAEASYGAGELEAAIAAWEGLHALELARGDRLAAARAAAMIGMYLMMDTGLMAPVRGWLRVAEHLLAGHTRTAAHALVAMTRTYERFMSGDMDAAREHASSAIELGEATGVTPAVVIGRVAAARVRIFDGDVPGGLADLDHVGALLMSGGADALTTGMMYCELICAAQGLGQHDMASQWTEVMEGWRHGAAVGGINGRCRVHRAELLRVSGPCDAAEAEALGACEELRPWMRREFGWPLVELGNIRLRRGDLDGAEAAFVEAHEHAWSPQPGLALVHLARGDATTAASMIRDAIDHPFDVPSKERPPFGDLRLAPLLDAQAEIADALGDEATVRAAADHLAAIAARYPSPFLDGWTLLARARLHLLGGDATAAIDASRSAMIGWTELGAPYEASTARLVLGRAYAAAGDQASAAMEWRAAAATFAAFGAARRSAEADASASGATSATRPHEVHHGAEARASAVVFCLEDGQRVVELSGRRTTSPDLKGYRYVARLLAEPGREFHVLDLVAAESGVLRGGEAGLPVLDDVARDAYRRRLDEIDADIDEARVMNDPGRVQLAERDREYLVAELARAVGLGGRARTTGGSAERARTSVTRTIRYALDQLGEVQPELAQRLRRTVRTGTYCVYEDDPVAPLRWRLSP